MPSLSNIEPYISGDTLYANRINMDSLQTTDAIISNSLTVSSPLLTTDPTNNRVGINTAVPTSSLDARNLSTASSTVCNFYAPNLLDGNYTRFRLGYAGTSLNHAYLDFHKLGDGSSSNYFELGLSPSYPILTAYGTGSVTITGDTSITGIINMATYLRTTYGSTLPSYSQTDVGYNICQAGGQLNMGTTGTATNVGGTVVSLPAGVWMLSGYVNIDVTSGSATTSSIKYGFSSSNSSFTNQGTTNSTFKVTNDVAARTISFGNTETYPALNCSCVVTLSASTNIYLLCAVYYSAGTPHSNNSNFSCTRIA